jgi:hypothetical protein
MTRGGRGRVLFGALALVTATWALGHLTSQGPIVIKETQPAIRTKARHSLYYTLYGVIALRQGVQWIVGFNRITPVRRFTRQNFRDMRFTHDGRQWTAIFLNATVVPHHAVPFGPIPLVLNERVRLQASRVTAVELRAVNDGVDIVCELFPPATRAVLLTSPEGFAWIFLP